MKRTKSLHEESPEEVNSTTVIDSRDANIYLNVAPRPPQALRSVSKPAGTGSRVKSPTEKDTSKVHANTKSALKPKETSKVSNSKEAGTSRVASKTASTSKSPDSRQHFAKRPLPKRQGRVPVRPAPPCPYMVHVSRKVPSRQADVDEYMYVDPSKIRYRPGVSSTTSKLSRDIDGLDLSGCGEFDKEGGCVLYSLVGWKMGSAALLFCDVLH